MGGNLKKSNNFEDVVVNGRIILNWNLEIRMHGQQNIKKPTINISNVSLSLSKYLYGVLAESSLQQNLRANTFNVILKSFNLPQ